MRSASDQYSIWKKYYLFKRYGLNNWGDENIHAFVVDNCWLGLKKQSLCDILYNYVGLFF